MSRIRAKVAAEEILKIISQVTPERISDALEQIDMIRVDLGAFMEVKKRVIEFMAEIQKDRRYPLICVTMTKKETDEKTRVSVSKPATKVLSAEDMVRFKVLIKKVCRRMGFTDASINKGGNGFEVRFIRLERKPRRMTNKDGALEYIREHPGSMPSDIAKGIGAKAIWSLRIDELEEEGLIRSNEKGGWEWF